MALNAIRIALPIVALSMIAGCAPAPNTSDEAAQLVLAHEDWVAMDRRCPADVLPASASSGPVRVLDCEEGKAEDCLHECAQGDVDGCFGLGLSFDEAGKHTKAARVLHQRACALGSPIACTNRAAHMFRFNGDARCAARTFEMTCESGIAWGCAMRGIALHEGKGVARDDGAARIALSKVCPLTDLEDRACVTAKDVLAEISAAGSAHAR